MRRNNISLFNFKSHQVRVVEIDGEPVLIAMDVCDILGIENTGVAYSRLDASDKCYICRTDVGLKPGRPLMAVSESGLYKLIMRSDKPEAKPFRDWVTREVLPAIRKTGGYLLNEEAREVAHADDQLGGAWHS